MKIRVGLVIIALLAALSWGASGQGRILDLSAHDFNKDGHSLSGKWEFYWNQLLSPTDFSTALPFEDISVPQSWSRLGHPLLGVATYRLRLLLPDQQQGLALFFPVIDASSKIWINGTLIKETGVVSADRQVYQPRLMSAFVPLPEKTKSIDLIVQVANFSYTHAGIGGSSRIDRSSTLVERMNRTNGVENFFSGSLIALFIYQVILYFLFQRGKPYLWLALICLSVALRSLIIHGGSFLLPNLFPQVSWEIWKKIEYGGVYAVSALFPLYVYHLFPDFSPRKPIRVFVIVALALVALVIVTPQYIYGRVLDVCHLMLVLGFIYAFYSIRNAWKAGSEDAKIILFGVLASFPFILIEILKNSRLLFIEFGFMFLVEIGVLVFLIFQVFLLASHYAKAYRQVEVARASLEKTVTERTSQLTTANEVKDRLLSIMSHDIRSPLNSLRGLLTLFNQGHMTKDELTNFAKVVERDLNKTGMLVDNILFWTAAQLKGVKIKMESFDLARLIEQNIQLLQTFADSKKLRIIKEVTSPLVMQSDKNILYLVLRNLLSNVIKFSREEDTILIRAGKTSTHFFLEVKDNGTGIDEETLHKLNNPKETRSKEGTEEEKGAGLGLLLSRTYLSEIGGQLLVSSEEGKGSTFRVELPLTSVATE